MKRFIYLTTTLVLIVIGILITFEFTARAFPNPYKYKNQYLTAHANEIETLILGSSHSYYGIAPQYLEGKSFNLANISQVLMYDYLLLDNYISEMSSLKKVILPISYFTFITRGFENTEDWMYAINYKVYMDINYHSNFSKYNYEISNANIAVSKAKKVLKRKAVLQCDELGNGNNIPIARKSGDWDDAKDALIRHKGKNFDRFETNYLYFEKIISTCKANDIELILLTTPTRPSYHENLDKKQLDLMFDTIKKATEKYDLRYYNYLYDTHFEADDFYDTDHLSYEGAVNFTKQFQSDISK